MLLSYSDERARELNSKGQVVKYGGLNGSLLLGGIVFTACVAFSFFGYDQGLMSGIIGSYQFNTEFPATASSGPNDVHTGTVRGTVVSSYEWGCFFGALFSFCFGEKLGRRRVLMLGGSIIIIGTLISVIVFGPGNTEIGGNVGGFVQFFVGRVITGVGNGMLTSTVPAWVAECSKAHNRGFLICLEASMVAAGTLIAYWINFGISYVDNSASWRFPIAFQLFFAAIMMTGVSLMPESPRWLINHGYNDEALRVVAGLAGKSAQDEVAVAEHAKLVDVIAAQRAARAASKTEILRSGKQQNRQRALVGASTQIFQQLGGCNAVIYYATILFEEQIGLETRLSLVLGGVLSIVYALFAFSSFLIVEKAGRRNLFLIGTYGQAAAMFITFGCLLAGTQAASRGAAFGLYLFIAFFGATWLPLPWLYPAELNSLSVRTQANAVSTMSNWLMNGLVVQVLPTMTASIGAYTFLIFALANVLFLPVIYLFYPETSRRTLEEIDVLYAHSHLTDDRAVKVAKELPKLTDHQVSVMTHKYDIHGGAADVEKSSSFGAMEGSGQPDTTLPPAHPTDLSAGANDDSSQTTRVNTPTGLEAADSEKKDPSSTQPDSVKIQ